MTKVDQAVHSFTAGCSCSQAMLSTYGEQLGVDRQTAMKIATGFGGGMGRMGETCGAVTGAMMVLGLRYGADAPEDQPAKAKTYELVREFVRQFKARNGSVICRELLDWDISTDEGFQRAKEKNLISTICPQMVRSAAEIVEELL